MDSEFMEAVAKGLAAAKIRVLRFEFPYMAEKRATGKQKPPDRAPVLEEAWRAVVAAHPHDRLSIGGKSLGGRMAARVAPTVAARGLVCLGFPFHPPGNPEKLRVDDLAGVKIPALIVQGERDPFGTRDEVEGYRLPESAKLLWMPDGDHSFAPRKSSGHTEEGNLEAAVKAVAAFIKGL